eukprot:CAMPEP_0170361540 /NCGR_PEP_ID=MMETSP0117_2-20130122/3859_1 /TAXON_ID=400756 /ORGANISM="Durinskia baltica, Strain CSIRO CS-38" /LENGTH=523 /DNA_ID=CAMNT_0010615909 /DNA_START=8 /DNA_END=1579 /DNA_ORIENTATION=-
MYPQVMPSTCWIGAPVAPVGAPSLLHPAAKTQASSPEREFHGPLIAASAACARLGEVGYESTASELAPHSVDESAEYTTEHSEPCEDDTSEIGDAPNVLFPPTPETSPCPSPRYCRHIDWAGVGSELALPVWGMCVAPVLQVGAVEFADSRPTPPPPQQQSMVGSSPDGLEAAGDRALSEIAAGDGAERAGAVRWIASDVWALATSAMGCRVVQEALPLLAAEELAAVAEGMKGRVIEGCHSPHANHVLQRLAEVSAPEVLQFMVDELTGHADSIAAPPLRLQGLGALAREVPRLANEGTDARGAEGRAAAQPAHVRQLRRAALESRPSSQRCEGTSSALRGTASPPMWCGRPSRIVPTPRSSASSTRSARTRQSSAIWPTTIAAASSSGTCAVSCGGDLCSRVGGESRSPECAGTCANIGRPSALVIPTRSGFMAAGRGHGGNGRHKALRHPDPIGLMASAGRALAACASPSDGVVWSLVAWGMCAGCAVELSAPPRRERRGGGGVMPRASVGTRYSGRWDT